MKERAQAGVQASDCTESPCKGTCKHNSSQNLREGARYVYATGSMRGCQRCAAKGPSNGPLPGDMWHKMGSNGLKREARNTHAMTGAMGTHRIRG